MRKSVWIMLGILAALFGQLAGCAVPGKPTGPSASTNRVLREQIEWCDTWVTDADKDDLPRVLLLGDSITRGYFKDVETRLAGKAHCARVTTSKGINDPFVLPEIELVLAQYEFKVIHVNNGLHGVPYTEEQYAKAFGPFLQAIAGKAGGARLIWAHTTPVMLNGTLENQRTEQVKGRNRVAAEFALAHNIPIDDLFGLAMKHPEYYSPDGVHFNKLGVEAQAKQVAGCISTALDDQSSQSVGRPDAGFEVIFDGHGLEGWHAPDMSYQSNASLAEPLHLTCPSLNAYSRIRGALPCVGPASCRSDDRLASAVRSAEQKPVPHEECRMIVNNNSEDSDRPYAMDERL